MCESCPLYIQLSFVTLSNATRQATLFLPIRSIGDFIYSSLLLIYEHGGNVMGGMTLNAKKTFENFKVQSGVSFPYNNVTHSLTVT